MVKAHEAYRRGEYAGAITDAGASFERIMKTICHRKSWAFDPNKDTCKALTFLAKLADPQIVDARADALIT